ncbi:MAG: PAS domain-containing protein [Actinomycetota bacterium]
MAQTEPLAFGAPQRRDAILEAVAFTARRLVETSDWRLAVGDVLRRLGEAAQVSRTHILENHPDALGRAASSQRFEWCAPGITSQMDNPELQNEPWAPVFADWAQRLEGGEPVAAETGSLPIGQRRHLEEQGTRRICLVPVMAGNNWWGTIGFDDCVERRDWDPAEIDALVAAAGILGAAIERQRAEQQVTETEIRYRALIEHTPLVTYEEVVPEGVAASAAFIYISPQVRGLLGYEPELWRTEGFWSQILHPDDLSAIDAASEQAITTGEQYRQDYRFVAADGHTVWVHDEAQLVTSPGAWPQRWHGALLDITDRKDAEQQLEHIRARLQAIVDNTPVLIYAEPTDEDSEDLFLSPQVERMLGWTADEWLEADEFWLEHIHPDDLDMVRELDGRGEDTFEDFVCEYRFRHKDGHWVWLRDHAVVVFDDTGHPSHWQGCMIDITQRKRMERALRQTEMRFRTLVEHMPAVTYVEGLVPREVDFYISPQVERIFGYTAEEWRTTEDFWWHHVHPDDLEAVSTEDERTNRTGKPVMMEYRFRAADGSYRWVHDEAVLVHDEDGGPSFWQGFLLDITERREAEEQLARALQVERDAAQRLRETDEMKDTFLQAVSHDLRTPLAAILGLAVTLGRDDLELDPVEGRELAVRIAQNARKLQRLVTDLLDLDRLARGLLEPARQPIELGGLLRSIVENTELLGDHPVEVSVAPQPLIAALDGAKLERIVENLLANAARHTPKDTPVWVRAVRRSDGVLLSVEDAGPGVPSGERATIFEAFRQGSDAPTHSPGIGVGLTLVARFAELHGGRAWVEDREGGGAAFRVLLPDGDLGTAWREDVG